MRGSETASGIGLGSAMTAYAPYVICSIFAGALSDRWNKKKILLSCDTLAAVCTLAVLILLKTERLQIWHLYAVNAVTGLMNTVQQPATEVATTALLPKKHYQKVGGLPPRRRRGDAIPAENAGDSASDAVEARSR